MKRHLPEAAVTKIMEHLLERFGEPIGKTVSDRQAVTDERGGRPHRGKMPKNSNRGFGAKFETTGPMTCDQCGGMMGMDQCCSCCGAMPTTIGTTSGEAIVVVGGHSPGPGNGQRGQSSKGVSSNVHPPQFMDDIPTTGSGRGTTQRQAASIAAPKPMPASLNSFNPSNLTQATMPTSGGSSPPASSPPPPSNGGSSPPPSMDQAMTHERMAEDLDEEEDLDEKAPPGREKQVRALKKQKNVDNPFAVSWASYNKSHGDK